jgi:hypothetical protein
MRISFDLDDTLICYQPGVPQEPSLRWPWSIWFPEPLRLGAKQLIGELWAQGWEVWIYTTSYRSPSSVKWWLWCHGIRVRGVINQNIHDKHLRKHRDDRPPSKNPKAFGIGLHIDDSDGVAIEGKQYGFTVVVLAPNDEAWVEKVRTRVASLRK